MGTRPQRSGEYTCGCNAYRFPHRFGGGKCTGISIVVDHWDKYYGHCSTCKNCNSFDDQTHSCQVLDGGNTVRRCEALIDFVSTNNISYPL